MLVVPSPSDVDAKLAESEDDDELEELEELLGSSVLLVSMGSISLAFSPFSLQESTWSIVFGKGSFSAAGLGPGVGNVPKA